MSATGAVITAPEARADAPERPGDDGTISIEAHLMGGRVGIHVRPARPPSDRASSTVDDARLRAGRDAARTMRRIASWAGRLTRFAETSELSRLNAGTARSAVVRPTLGAVLAVAAELGRASDGIVDPTVLLERLAAEDPAGATRTEMETGPDGTAAIAARRWSLAPSRRGAIVTRDRGVRFDLGGVAKGWIADRAVHAMAAHPAALVDADGDIAIALAFGEAWRVAVDDPRTDGATLGAFDLVGLDPTRRQQFGLATSGTSVHHWAHDGRVAHHLIDPRTRRPAVTDVVQATVLANSATAAEAAAKTIIILGSARAEALLDHPAVRACLILTDDGRVLASPSVLRWLA